MITLTKTQYAYAVALDENTMTTGALADRFGVTCGAVGQQIHRLRAKGVVASGRREGGSRHHQHWLLMPLSELECNALEVVGGACRHISVAELEYAAGLRGGGWTGRELADKFRERYPDRRCMKGIIFKARRLRYCR